MIHAKKRSIRRSLMLYPDTLENPGKGCGAPFEIYLTLRLLLLKKRGRERGLNEKKKYNFI
jgi:hypothetical protein